MFAFLSHFCRLLCRASCSQAGPRPTLYLTDDTSVTDEVVARRLPLDARAVHLDGTRITDAAATYLGRCLGLEELVLDRTAITDEAAKNLTGLVNLTGLYLQFTHLTDESLRSIGRIESLEDLWLSGTNVGDAGLKHLAPCKSLREIHLAGTAATADGIRELQQEFPKARIYWRTVPSAPVQSAAIALARMGLEINPWDQAKYPATPMPTSCCYRIDLRENILPAIALKTANELIRTISDGEPVYLMLLPLTENNAAIVRGLSHVSSLDVFIDKKTAPTDLQALATIGRVDCLAVRGIAPDLATMDALSSVRGVTEFMIETHGSLPDTALTRLSRMKTLTKLRLMFQGCDDDCLEQVIKLGSLRELVVPTSISSKAISKFRAVRPERRCRTARLVLSDFSQ